MIELLHQGGARRFLRCPCRLPFRQLQRWNREFLLSGQVQGHRDGFGFLIRDDGGQDLVLAVNLSVRQFTQPGLVETVEDAVAASGIDMRLTPRWVRSLGHEISRSPGTMTTR